MMCLLSMKDGQPDGWIIATDADELRRECESRGGIFESNQSMRPVAEWLYRNSYGLRRGKHELPGGLLLLVD